MKIEWWEWFIYGFVAGMSFSWLLRVISTAIAKRIRNKSGGNRNAGKTIPCGHLDERAKEGRS